MINLESIVPGKWALFQFVTADNQSPDPLILLAMGLADFGPFLALAIAGYVFFTEQARRHAAALAGAALLLGLATNFTIATLLYVPRPFELGFGLNLLHHAPETSFPSDHATFIWSLGFALILLDRMRWPGIICVLLGAATAWARVYLGAHFPLDMLASLIVSAAATLLVIFFKTALSVFLFPLADYCHGIFLKILRHIWPKKAGY